MMSEPSLGSSSLCFSC